MKWSRLATIAAGVLVIGWVTVELLGSKRSTPAEILDDVQRRFASGGADARVLVRDLDRALEDPRTTGDEALLTDLLLTRSEVSATLGDLSMAREDLQRVLTLYRRGDLGLELRAAELEALDGLVAEALVRARRLIERSDDPGPVWQLVGRLERELAEAVVHDAAQLVVQNLAGVDAVEVRRLLVELGARDPDDRTRRRLADELVEYLPGSDFELTKDLLDAADAASRHNAAARAALSNALQGGPHAATGQALIELLRRAGRPELAVDLATTLRLDPTVFEDGPVLEATLDALVDLGHVDRAQEMIRRWPWDTGMPSRQLCEKALRALLDADDTRGMAAPLGALRATQEQGVRYITDFYQGVQLTERAESTGEARSWERADDVWTDFLAGTQLVEPVPGAIAYGHVLRARCRGALGDEAGERADLLRALTPPLEAAEEVWFSRITGQEYLRLANLTSGARNTGYRAPEERYTRAMSLMPERWAELAPRWNQLGALSLERDAGYSFAQILSSARNAGSPWPTIDVGPNTTQRVARAHLESGNYEAALAVGRSLLETYPGLVPAWDVVIEAQILRGSRLQVMIDLLDRLALTGPDEKTARYLAAIGESALRPDQRLEWMRLDPTGYGRRTMVTHLLLADRPGAALRAVGDTPTDPADEPEDLRVLRGRALLELERHEEVLATMTAGDPLTSEAAMSLELQARFALTGSRDLAPLLERIVTGLTGNEPPRLVALEAVDRLLSAGDAAAAGELLDALDARPETRGGDVLERMVLHRLLIDDRDGALEALERAEAFFGDGRVELRRVLLGIADRDWRGLPRRSTGARATLGDDLDPWLDAALALLEERLEAGLELASAGLAEEPQSPLWGLLHAIAAELSDQRVRLPLHFGLSGREEMPTFLRGSEEIGRDPRAILGLLIAIEHAGWSLHAEKDVEELRDLGVGAVWPAWFLARSLERQGRLPEARQAYQRLATVAPDFGPAWDGWERTLLADSDRLWSPERIRLRAARSTALGRAGADPLDAAIDEACAATIAGEGREGIVRLIRGLGESPGRQTAALQLLGSLYLGRGDTDRAVAAFTQALPASNRVSDDPIVEQLVATLRTASLPSARATSKLSLAEIESALEDLTQAYPRDPLPVLEWARLRSETERRSPAVVVDMISRTFEAMRDQTGGAPLESLRRGSAQSWGEFLMEVAPDVAEQMALEDLAATPGDLTLWRLLAETVASQGRSEDARDLYEALVAMSGDPASHHAYAWFLLEHGATRAEILLQLDAAEDLIADEPQDPSRGRFVAALTELRLAEKPRLPGLINTFGSLWERRRENSGVPKTLLGRAYASALISRRTARDLSDAGEVLAELARSSDLDPYLPDVALALEGLCRTLPVLVEGEEDDEARRERRERKQARGEEEE